MAGYIENYEPSTVADYSNRNIEEPCIVYKFQSRPPYEGFVLILIIILISILFLWWLNKNLYQ
jgi:hypothetical protein